jgi:hypothetical protein
MWIAVNLIEVFMWWKVWTTEGNSISILLMWLVFLFNGIFFFIRWKKDGGSMDYWREHVGRADAFLSDRTAHFMRELGEMTRASISTLDCSPSEHVRLYLSSEPASLGADNARVTDLEILGHTLYFRDSTSITIRAVPEDGCKVTGFLCKIGPREEQFSGDTLSFSLLAKSTVTVLTEKIDP